MSKLEVTEVFEWNWSAMNLKAYNVILTDNEISFLVYDSYEQDYILGKKILRSEIDLSKYKIEEYETITYLTDINDLKEYPEYLINRYKYIVNEGSSRSSKTASLIDCFHLYAEKYKGKRCTIWRDTKTDCKKTVLADTIKHLKRTDRFFKANFNKTESVFTYPNHSTVEIHGTDDEETVHGLTQDISWFNEPYKISVDTFDQIDQRTSDFVFIDWNPKKDSWIDDVKKKHNAITIKSTFKNNYFCPIEQRDKLLGYQSVKQSNVVLNGVLDEIQAFNYDYKANELNINEKDLKELIRCIENQKKNSANAFKWSVYGLGEKGERPHRIYHWNECNYLDYLALPFEEWFGCDWGKVDPWAIVGGKYDPSTNKLYVHEYLYMSEDNIDKVIDNETKRRIKQDGEEGIVNYMFKRLNIPLKAKIVCDNNRPNKVEQLRRFGYENAVVAEKGAGSIIDGIELLDYGVDVYYTNTSHNIKVEQEEYSWKVDRYGNVLEAPEGGKDHCFTGDTLISTINGEVPIKDIKVGDLVLTSNGYKKVLIKWDNGIKKVKDYSMQLNTFFVSLSVTDNHLIKTDKEWKKISRLKEGMMVYYIKPTKDLNTNFIKENVITQGMIKKCIGLFGKLKMENKDPKDTTFTTSMAILIIINLIILSLSKAMSIYVSMVGKTLKKMRNGLKNFTQKVLKKLKNGISQKQVSNGIDSTQSITDLEIENTEIQTVKNVIKNLLNYLLKIVFARLIAGLTIGESRELMMNLENVFLVIANLKQTNIQEKNIAQINVLNERFENVYDLTIEDEHEYFANGLLVHNCLDASKYLATKMQAYGLIKKV